MKQSRLRLCLKITLALILLASLCQTASRAAIWQNVAISGSQCWVTDIVVHPTQPGLVYARTDVGGCHRWDAVNSRWIPLTDWLTLDQRAYFSVESIALDPSNPNVVYIACGAYVNPFLNPKNGVVFRSNDQGKTWTQLSLSVPMGGNQDRRWGGERLSVSPDGQTLLFGSRISGLWRYNYNDAGKTWTGAWRRISTVPVLATITTGTYPYYDYGNNYGVCATAFDPNTPGLAYAAVYVTTDPGFPGYGAAGGGVYVSTDYGKTWKMTNGGPQSIMRMTVASDHTLWVTGDLGVGCYSNGTWTYMNPSGVYYAHDGRDADFGAIAVNPLNSSNVLVSSSAPTSSLWETWDHGMHWLQLQPTRNLTVPWFQISGSTQPFQNVTALAFDPFNVQTVWACDDTGISRCDQIGSFYPAFTQQETGHEQLVPLTLAAPPSGPELLSGFLDVDGFAHTNGPDTYPAHQMGGAAPGHWVGATLSIAYQEKDPTRMARAVTLDSNNDSGTVLCSKNGGSDWSQPGTLPDQPIRVAVSSDDPNRMFVLGAKSWMFTTDGTTWNPCAGSLPAPAYYSVYSQDTPIAADSYYGWTFYAYVGGSGNGKIYQAADAGMTFQCVNSTLPQSNWEVLKAGPNRGPNFAGDLWICLDQDTTNNLYPRNPTTEGLYHSTDAGAHWAKMPSLARCYNFCFGKAAPGNPNPTLYAYGRTSPNLSDHVLQSLDLGASWHDFNDPSNPLGDIPTVMEGSRQTYGRVFVGTSGRGVFYSSP